MIKHSGKIPRKSQPPATLPVSKVGEAGSAKRNIIRRRGGDNGATICGKKNAPGGVIDDGSMYDDPIACGEGDPNYEDPFEYDDTYFAQGMSVYRFTENRIQLGNSKITLTIYKQSVEPIIKEYFVSGDVDNLLDCIHELEATEYGYELVKRSINMSFDQGDREREMVSRMLSTAYPDTLSSSMIGKGFERLFELVDEIEKDCPNAREMITTFLARAVIDEVVPPSFLADPVVCNLGGDVVAHAKRMLSRDHAGAQLERIWGPGDGRPVADLKIATDHLLQEYLGSGLKDEAARCVKQLAAPYFHHEIVKRAIVCALDRSVEQRQSMSALLEYLVKEEMVSQAQATKGFRRIYGIISDLILDTPNAPSLVNEFTQRAIEAEVLPHTCKELMTGDTQCADE